jgi:uncharacterized delta-60 repeat protein
MTLNGQLQKTSVATGARCRLATLLIAAAAQLGVSAACLAAPSDLDTSFADTGVFLRVVGPYWDVAGAAALQVDGKILEGGSTYTDSNLVARNMALIRHNSDSTSDSTFGAGTGQVVTPIAQYGGQIIDLAVQPDGKIIGGGYSIQGNNTQFALVRYNSNGTLDTTFGGGTGKVTTSLNAYASPGFAMALQRDGKMLVAGEIMLPSTSKAHFAVVRYNTNGTIDTSFGTGGTTTIAMSATGNESARSVIVQADGKIVLAGYANRGSGDDIALARLTAAGALDTTFGVGGKVFTSLSGASTYADQAYAVAQQPDGKLVVTGWAAFDQYGNQGLAVVRYTSTGALDTSFNGSGYRIHSLGSTEMKAYSVAVLPTGQILTAGTYKSNGYSRFVVARFTGAGAMDTAFGNGLGYVTTPILNAVTEAGDLAVSPNGKFYVTGYSNGVFAVARYLGDAIDVGPDAVSFAGVTGAAPSTVQISNMVTVSGLTPGASVPIVISGGTFSVNGGAYQAGQGWVKNGDQLRLKHVSSATSGAKVTTAISFGGLYAPNNRWLILGSKINTSFSSTTL